MLVVGLGEIEGAGIRRPGVAGSPSATEKLRPGRMVVAVGVKDEGVEEGRPASGPSNSAIATARLSSTTGDPVRLASIP